MLYLLPGGANDVSQLLWVCQVLSFVLSHTTQAGCFFSFPTHSSTGWWSDLGCYSYVLHINYDWHVQLRKWGKRGKRWLKCCWCFNKHCHASFAQYFPPLNEVWAWNSPTKFSFFVFFYLISFQNLPWWTYLVVKSEGRQPRFLKAEESLLCQIPKPVINYLQEKKKERKKERSQSLWFKVQARFPTFCQNNDLKWYADYFKIRSESSILFVTLRACFNWVSWSQHQWK